MTLQWVVARSLFAVLIVGRRFQASHPPGTIVATDPRPSTTVADSFKTSTGDHTALSTSDWIAVSGDILVVIGFVVAYAIYRKQRFDGTVLQLDSTINVLTAVMEGMKPWGNLYFGGAGYSLQAAQGRAQDDYDAVMDKRVPQVFRVPTDPIENLVQQPWEGWLIDSDTIVRANIALWKAGIFNQFVDQQTAFLTLHMHDILGSVIDPRQRRDLARAYKTITVRMHWDGIGDDRWYPELMEAIKESSIGGPVAHLRDQSAAVTSIFGSRDSWPLSGSASPLSIPS